MGAMAPRIVLLLGKPPQPGTIIAEVRHLLETEGIDTSTFLPHEADQVPVDVDGLSEPDLVVQRGLSPAVHPLLEQLDHRGIAMCNPWHGAPDRSAFGAALARAGVPTPSARSVETWAQVLELARGRQVVAKAASGGRGSGVVAGRAPAATPDSGQGVLPEEPPGRGPYVVEQLIEHDGTDRKLYVAGDVVSGLLKPSTLTGAHSTRGEPFPVPERLRELALAATAALDLHLAGIDVVEDRQGRAWVVDVNEFPGYRSVPGAARAITDHLLHHLGAAVHNPG